MTTKANNTAKSVLICLIKIFATVVSSVTIKKSGKYFLTNSKPEIAIKTVAPVIANVNTNGESDIKKLTIKKLFNSYSKLPFKMQD